MLNVSDRKLSYRVHHFEWENRSLQFRFHGRIATGAVGGAGRRIAGARLAWLLVRMHQRHHQRGKRKVSRLDLHVIAGSERGNFVQKSRRWSSAATVEIHYRIGRTAIASTAVCLQGTTSMGPASAKMANHWAAGWTKRNIPVRNRWANNHRLLCVEVAFLCRLVWIMIVTHFVDCL